MNSSELQSWTTANKGVNKVRQFQDTNKDTNQQILSRNTNKRIA